MEGICMPVRKRKQKNAGSVSSFTFDSVKGSLSFINKQRSGGENPAIYDVEK